MSHSKTTAGGLDGVLHLAVYEETHERPVQKFEMQKN